MGDGRGHLEMDFLDRAEDIFICLDHWSTAQLLSLQMAGWSFCICVSERFPISGGAVGGAFASRAFLLCFLLFVGFCVSCKKVCVGAFSGRGTCMHIIWGLGKGKEGWLVGVTIAWIVQLSSVVPTDAVSSR